MNGSASTCACRSPSRNENHGNSLIVSGDHARGREPVVVAQRPAVGDQQPRALEVAGDEHERDRGEPGPDRAARRRAPRPTASPPTREHRRGGQREQRGDGEVVALVGRDRGELDQHRHREVAEVVVVEVGARQPRVLGRERVGPVGGVEERHVHRLLGVPDVGRVGDEQRHRGEGDEEHGLRAPEQPPAQRVGLGRARGEPAPAPAGEPAARLAARDRAASLPAAHPGEQPERADERDPQRRAAPCRRARASTCRRATPATSRAAARAPCRARGPRRAGARAAPRPAAPRRGRSAR